MWEKVLVVDHKVHSSIPESEAQHPLKHECSLPPYHLWVVRSNFFDKYVIGSKEDSDW